MNISYYITQTAYGYDNLSVTASQINVRFGDVCSKISGLRHEISMNIYDDNVSLQLNPLYFNKDKIDFNLCSENILNYDEYLLKSVDKLNTKDNQELYLYLHNHIDATLDLIAYYSQLFAGENNQIDNSRYICTMCGYVDNKKKEQCTYCEAESRLIVRIDCL